MGNEMADSNNNSKEFDLKSELSNLVAEKIIPSKIADKLEQRLTEKQIKISKEQLYILVNKIRGIMNGYSKSDRIKDRKIDFGTQTDMDMLKLTETIEELQKRIANLEGDSSPRFSTTNDVSISEKITVPVHDGEMNPLTYIPSDAENIIVLMKWLQYLVDKCGHIHLSDILDYYVDIGWITEDAKINLLDYSQGITEGKRGDSSSKGVSNLPAKDHIQSLMYIQRLKGVKLDKHFLDRIEAELSRLNKKLDQYHQFKY